MRRLNIMGALTAGGLVALGFVLFARKGAAAPAAATVAPSGGMPSPLPGESSPAYAERIEAWGLQSGQAYPTIEGFGAGFGRTGPLWRSRGMVPAGRR